MVARVTIAENHIHVSADSFSAEGGFGERCGHGKEIDQAAFPASHDGGQFRTFDVHHVYHHVGHPAIGEARHFFLDGDGVGGAGEDNLVAAGVFAGFDVGWIAHDADHFSGNANPLAGNGVAEYSALAVGAQDNHRVAGPGQTFHLGWSARNVQNRQGQVFVHVVRQFGIDAAAEEDCLAFDFHLVLVQQHPLDLVDFQRRQRKRDHAGDGVAYGDFVFHLKLGADLRHPADQHSAGAGVLVFVLARAVNQIDGVVREGFFQVCVSLGDKFVLDLVERGGIHIEADHVDEQFIIPDLAHVIVQNSGRLGQYALGFDNPVCAETAAAGFHIQLL
ncbi:MAG: hypothetical protein BWX83_01157 [Candidatus Cloacimonetes bacterium ADurb.Bin117]|nr:MAG: hypothetical protein BWX83_01157 [Candidatus Cloacimonetes bacterium ADurb.Bin117]